MSRRRITDDYDIKNVEIIIIIKLHEKVRNVESKVKDETKYIRKCITIAIIYKVDMTITKEKVKIEISWVESYQRLKKWYLMPLFLTLSVIR